MRRRAFWIALPVAIVFALWAGPALSEEDELPRPVVAEPLAGPIFEPGVKPTPEPAHLAEIPPPTLQLHTYPECDEPADPGPDGDR